MQSMERGYVLLGEAGMHWQNQLLGTAGAKLELVGAFKKQSKSGAKQLPRSMVKTLCLITAKRLQQSLATTQ